MKHLLSILTLLGIVSLIFVSCSKSPEQYIENCADTRFIDTRENKIAYLEKPNDAPIMSGLKIKWYKGNISFVKSKSLQKKLQKKDYYHVKFQFGTDVYSDFFKECSYQLERDEVYFKAKWK